jgi:chemotaxis protein CheY-P-specific phosphatase CheC
MDPPSMPSPMMDEMLVGELLKELGAKGADAMAASLTKLLGKVTIDIQNVFVADQNSLAGMTSGIDVPVTANFVPLHGYLDGSLLFVMDIDSAELMSDILTMGLGATNRALMKISSLKELANVLTSSVVNVFSDIFSWKIVPLPGIYIMDSIDSVVAFTSNLPPRVSRESLVINLVIKQQDLETPATLLLMVEEGGIRTLCQHFFDPFGSGNGVKPSN